MHSPDMPTDIPDTLRAFAPTDEAGNVQARLGLVVTLYVLGGTSGPLRSALEQLAVEFDELAGNRLRWIAQSHTGRWQPVKNGKRPAPGLAAGFAKVPDGNEWGVAMHCGETMESASELAFAIYVPWAWEVERLAAASYVTAHLPVDWFTDRAEGFGDLVMRWATLLQPMHGYAGFGLNLSVDSRSARNATPMALPFALRAPGLELDNPVHHSIAASRGIKSVNWLTILSDDWLAKAGGHDVLRTELGSRYTLRDYPGGSIIQAGAAPQIGDVNRGLIPVEYRDLSVRLHALREPFYTADTNHSIREWLTRFDRMDAVAAR
jgi:hypothetical protein